MNIPSVKELLEAGVHFGHSTSRWHPKMKPFIYFERQGIHVIDLEKTRVQLVDVLNNVRRMAREGKVILFISTKPQAKAIVKQAAIDCGMPYLVERWIGGLLTNFTEMKKLFTNYLKLKDQKATGEIERYTKQEQVKIIKDLEKMDTYLDGIAHLTRIPDVLFIPSVHQEKTALTEANKTDVQVVGVCDTNSNPDKVNFVIPANDDATRSITMIVGLVSEAVKEGRREYEQGLIEARAIKPETDTPTITPVEVKE